MNDNQFFQTTEPNIHESPFITITNHREPLWTVLSINNHIHLSPLINHHEPLTRNIHN